MAREIQLAILPREIPKLKGLEIAARYLPMSSVAGDFYDFIILDEKHVGVLIADVSGHGLPAAVDRLHAEGFTDRATPARIGTRAGVGGIESSACAANSAPFCHRGLLIRGHGKELHQLRRRGASAAAAVARVNGESFGSVAEWPNARPFPRRNLRLLHVPNGAGRQGRPIHGRNTRND